MYFVLLSRFSHREWRKQISYSHPCLQLPIATVDETVPFRRLRDNAGGHKFFFFAFIQDSCSQTTSFWWLRQLHAIVWLQGIRFREWRSYCTYYCIVRFSFHTKSIKTIKLWKILLYTIISIIYFYTNKIYDLKLFYN